MNQGATENQCDHDLLCINTIRTLAMDAVQEANSGHPGAPMGLAPAAYVLWTRVLCHNPKNPHWPGRDRFVLSGGHASMLLYSLLHLTGYDLSLDDIKNFRQWGSKTPGHPEYGHTPGVEITTGPLGQGFAGAVGMAMAERHLAARFNQPHHQLVNHYTYVMCGDGDLMEGIASEAASLAGHLGLGKLICLYDDNKISIEGSTDIAFTEDVTMRFKAYDWHVLRVEDGNDIQAVETALAKAKAETGRPSLIVTRTQIAYGSPNKQGSADAHGAPLGEEEVCLTKKALGCIENETFCIPEAARTMTAASLEKGAALEAEWQKRYNTYKKKYPQAAQHYLDALNNAPAADWDRDVPDYTDQPPIASRAASGQVLNALAAHVPELIGGSADLAPSNKTVLNFSHDFQKDAYDGRNIRFGVREHAMAAILNGMALHKGVRPYGGTFLVFADYMRPAIRLAALMKLPVIYVFTHDSIAVGEDGPTHQPVEHVASLRMIPGLTVIRPADARETAAAWRQALQITDGPVALLFSRQKLNTLSCPAIELAKGAYIVADSDGQPDIILIATGSEVGITLQAGEQLNASGVKVRVVSMPSWELFEKTDQAYKDTILPPTVTKRLAVEAGVTMGWERYACGPQAIVGIDHFGASAPGGTLMEKFGFTADNIVARAKALLDS